LDGSYQYCCSIHIHFHLTHFVTVTVLTYSLQVEENAIIRSYSSMGNQSGCFVLSRLSRHCPVMKRDRNWSFAQSHVVVSSDGITVKHRKFVQLAQIVTCFRDHRKPKIIQTILIHDKTQLLNCCVVYRKL